FVLLQGGSIINPWLSVIDWLTILAAIGLLIAHLLSLSEAGMDERLLFGGAVALIAGAVAIWYGRPEWFELHRLVGLAVLIGCGLTLIEG
ncbi:hypothetical protein ABTE34_20340, partial [Acinetobacter baumannii]